MSSMGSLLIGWAVGYMEIIGILVVALVIFGNRLPQVGRNLARTITSFRKGLHEIEDEVREDLESVDLESDVKAALDRSAEPKQDAKAAAVSQDENANASTNAKSS